MKLLHDATIGESLKKYRRLKAYSQIDVAAKMQLYGSNMSSNSYSKIERGERNIFFDDFIVLKLVLGFEYSEFFKQAEDEILARRDDK